MASVTVSTANAQSQPQAEYLRANALTDATHAVACSLLGFGSGDIRCEQAQVPSY